MNNPRPAGLPEIHSESWDRLSRYCSVCGIELVEQFGWGYEGLVYSTVSKSAIKAFRHRELYENELKVYLRLRDHAVKAAHEFAVPRLISWNDEFLVIEMTIVSPPFILDFAGAYLDKRPPFDDEQLQEWEEQKMEQFEDRWPIVRSALSFFKGHGIYLNDVKPGNVTFGDEDSWSSDASGRS
jgi:hypothetical protein